MVYEAVGNDRADTQALARALAQHVYDVDRTAPPSSVALSIHDETPDVQTCPDDLDLVAAARQLTPDDEVSVGDDSPGAAGDDPTVSCGVITEVDGDFRLHIYVLHNRSRSWAEVQDEYDAFTPGSLDDKDVLDLGQVEGVKISSLQEGSRVEFPAPAGEGGVYTVNYLGDTDDAWALVQWIAAAIYTSPAPSSGVVVPSTSSNPAPTVAPTPAPSGLRPSETAKPSTPWQGVSWPEVTARTMKCLTDLGPATITQDVELQDFNGDGLPDAVVIAVCPASTERWSVHTLVYDGVSATGVPDLLGEMGGDERYLEARTVVDGTTIRMSGKSRSPKAPGCCADQQVDLTYRWSNGGFELVDRTAESLAPSNSVATTRATSPDLGGGQAFVTPSGNILCGPASLTDPASGVDCAMREADFAVPHCEGSQPGNMWHVDRSGMVRQSGPEGCRGDRAMFPNPVTAA